MSAPPPVITCGYLPLTDALMLIVAAEKGFAEAEGFELRLVRETSWANIRDRIGVGHFDVAHMLAPLAIAANLGLNPLPTRVVAPVVLGHGGNAVTVSLELWRRMQIAGAPHASIAAAPAGAALARAVASLGRRPRFGVVHTNSSHNYELRYWLAASGIAPDRDVEIVVLPPPLLPDALRSGDVDGYCVGEPWSSVGVEIGAGRIVTTKSAIWAASSDKVLGVRERWARDNAELLPALIRAVVKAADWCGRMENRAEAAALLAEPRHLGISAEVVERALSGEIVLGGGGTAVVERFYVPFADGATCPMPAEALWFYSQMVRWGEVRHGTEAAQTARATFRPDLYAAAVAPLGLTPPLPSALVEGFFDARRFDADQLDAYIAG